MQEADPDLPEVDRLVHGFVPLEGPMRTQCNLVVRAPASASEDPGFKTNSDHSFNF